MNIGALLNSEVPLSIIQKNLICTPCYRDIEPRVTVLVSIVIDVRKNHKPCLNIS